MSLTKNSQGSGFGGRGGRFRFKPWMAKVHRAAWYRGLSSNHGRASTHRAQKRRAPHRAAQHVLAEEPGQSEGKDVETQTGFPQRPTQSSGKRSYIAQRSPPCDHSALGGTPDSSKPHEKAAFHMVPPRPEFSQHRRNGPNPAGCTMPAGIWISKKKQASCELSLLWMRAPDSMLASSPTNSGSSTAGAGGQWPLSLRRTNWYESHARKSRGPESGHRICLVSTGGPLCASVALGPRPPLQGRRRAAGWGPDERGALECYSELSQELVGGRQDGPKRGNRCTRDPLSCLMCPIVPNGSVPPRFARGRGTGTCICNETFRSWRVMATFKIHTMLQENSIQQMRQCS